MAASSEAQRAAGGTSLSPGDERRFSAEAAALSKSEEDRITDDSVVDIQTSSPDVTAKPRTSFWLSLVKAATVVEDHLAEWFGLNQSKYQWAVDEYMDRQLTGEPQVRAATPKNLTEQQMQPIGQQLMHRDADQLEDL